MILNNYIYHLFLIALLNVFLINNSYAGIYKCKTSDGNYEYKDKPCATNEKNVMLGSRLGNLNKNTNTSGDSELDKIFGLIEENFNKYASDIYEYPDNPVSTSSRFTHLGECLFQIDMTHRSNPNRNLEPNAENINKSIKSLSTYNFKSRLYYKPRIVIKGPFDTHRTHRVYNHNDKIIHDTASDTRVNKVDVPFENKEIRDQLLNAFKQARKLCK